MSARHVSSFSNRARHYAIILGIFRLAQACSYTSHANELGQLVAQQLISRLLDAHAHLLSLNDCKVSNGNGEAYDGDNDEFGDGGGTDNDENDNGDDGDASSDDCSLRGNSPARLKCPYPACIRTKQFNAKADLKRHFQSRISPYALEKAVC